ncbi:hypothetical protein WJX81_006372 [Elliptochloris bilobata]|uniref:3-ketoacyl-CoA synthase n=1 Tax=Elliptochloris bilobata TaxID=381761 RepID=A0AAW1RN93_9CHLO
MTGGTQFLRYSKAAFHLVCSYAGVLLVVPLASVMARRAIAFQEAGGVDELLQMVQQWRESSGSPWVAVGVAAAALMALQVMLAALYYLIMRRRSEICLVDFYSYRPPDRMNCIPKLLIQGAKRSNLYTERSLEFMENVIRISGIGEPQGFLPDEFQEGVYREMVHSIANKRAETELALFTCVQKVLDKTGLKAKDVDALITNCCTFNPVPSLSAAVVNHFKMKQSVKTYHIGGMGCAASVIAMDLAQELLKNHPNWRVVIAGSDNCLETVYYGNQRNMLITNCLFRLGGVAAVLSNHPADRKIAKYRLDHLVRTHLGADDAAYNCVIQKDDEEGKIGTKIGREVMETAGKALKANITAIGPLVLPLSEKLIFVGNLFARKVLGLKSIKPYTPDFKTAFEHFCIHPGGKTVIEGVGSQLGLRPSQLLPMLRPFERYGNTSSSSTWYAWSFVETCQGVKRGQRLWQLSFGSGFKCASAAWTALRDCDEQHDAWTETPSC